MKHGPKTNGIQLLLFFLLFPGFAVLNTQLVFGIILLVGVVLGSVILGLLAPLEVDPAHAHRVKGGENAST